MPRIPRPFRRQRQTTHSEPEAPPTDVEQDNELRMTLWQHLEELRDRTIRAFLAIIVGTVLGALVAGQAFETLREPYCQLVDIPDQCELIVLGPTGGIVAYFRVALMIGGVLAVPSVTYQILMFVLPGLTNKERRMVLLTLPAITILFLLGVAFAWFILMPPALGFLEGFQPTLFEPEWTAELYINFVTSLLFWMGVAFETPLVFFLLSFLGIVGPRTLIRNWRVAIVVSAIAAALITPTVDPVNMFLVMGPLLVLYIISIFLVMLGQRMSRRRLTYIETTKST